MEKPAESLLWETLCSSTLEADPGDNVTLWCQHELDLAGYIYWFYQNSSTAALSTTSVPVLTGCRHFKTSGPANECYFYSGTKRMVMSVQGKNTSLTITAVNVSDTGLYYCGFMQLNQISFSNSSYLRVKD
ncbi:putative immune-type receptor 12a precursor [Clarias magur]|uniref:Putative immune-type receptor 12a n=1 Tax=Clarias magur TaxID=1594786 RepID=A0A8J4UBE9_CLAMG|nr:putative immune-type receptor 12a precursor [Clarias magur]